MHKKPLVGSVVRFLERDGHLGVVADVVENKSLVVPVVNSPKEGLLPKVFDFPGLGTGARIVADAARQSWVDDDKLGVVGNLDKAGIDRLLRARVEAAVRAFHTHGQAKMPTGAVLGVPVSGKVFGAAEMVSLMESSLDFWLTTGRFNDEFEPAIAQRVGAKYAFTVNSGSSANLLAVSALTSPLLGERRVKPGDEMITVAAGFPTTVNPIIQIGCVPVFVDVELGTYNADADLVKAAITPKTKAIVIAHTLGNPFDVEKIKRIAADHGLWLIEDSCDALGSMYALDGEEKPCGSFGDISTFSFYPAHHITTGEGGAVATSDPTLRRILLSLRDWGRDCWCAPGVDDTCKNRFAKKFGELPQGYDHKYVYSHVGYNLKMTDMQAAVGLVQLGRLDEFSAIRRRNFGLLTEGLKELSDYLILPTATRNSTPSWFGFPLTLRRGKEGAREDLMRYLNANGIGTRLLFGGNLTRQPYFKEVGHRIFGVLNNTDKIMRDTFWIGLYHGLTPAQMEYSVEKLKKYDF